jgi:hypothetical protein
MLAHGEHLAAGLSFLFLAGGSSVICLFIAIVLYLSDKGKMRRIQIVGGGGCFTIVNGQPSSENCNEQNDRAERSESY